MRSIMLRLGLLLAICTTSLGQDRYLARNLSELDWGADGPPPLERVLRANTLARRPHPSVSMDQGVEAWLGIPHRESLQGTGRAEPLQLGEIPLALRLDESRPGGVLLSGELWLPPATAGEAGTRHAFQVNVSDAGPADRQPYLQARYLACSWLLAREAPGAPLWRRLASTAEEELSLAEALPSFDPRGRLGARFGRRSGIDDAYGLFSGGRALSENLALDQVLQLEQGTEGWVQLSELEGVSTPPVDWTEELKGIEPKIDALARAVPAEQPFVHMSGLSELRALLAEMQSELPGLLEMFESSAEDAQLQARYERQLTLALDDTVTALSKLTVRGLALTASDPFLRTGTDVALLFETDGSELLPNFVRARHQAALAADEGVEEVGGTHAGVTFSGVRSRWREVSSYLVELPGNVVAVTNSPVQLRALVDAALGQRAPVAELPEYLVYRDRYPAASGEVFLLISDDTIRRWAGPRWRIAAARRTRAAAVMADEAAASLLRDSGAHGPRALRVRDDLRVPGGGGIVPRERGVGSGIYGTPEFLTPVVELEFEAVTNAEVQAYTRFRTAYERQWRDVFDPVGVRVVLGEESLELDLSIRPLSRRSDYRELINMVGGGRLKPGAGVSGEHVMAQMSWALDTGSGSFRDLQNMATSMAPALTDPLAWMGDHMTVYLDNAPFWDEAAKAEDPMKWIEDHIWDLPIGARIACKSPLQLAGFLAGLRAWIEQTAPGLVSWEPREHGKHRYVALVPTGGMGLDGLDLYYATQSDALLLGFTPEVIERALDAKDASAQGAAEQEEGQDAVPEALGLHALASVESAGLRLMGRGWALDNAGEMQLAAWDLLPLWEELNRRFPGTDPAITWAQYFPAVPALRGGDQLLWNTAHESFESERFGSPVNPRMEARAPQLFALLESMRGGLTFESGDGLRARMQIAR